MEHRCSTRIPIQLKVKVSSNDICLGVYKSRDMNLFGIFLKTGFVELPSDRTLDLRIIVNKQLPRLYHISAAVVYRTPDGVGLMFVKDNAPQNINLTSLLSEATQVKRSKKFADINHGYC